MQAAVIANLGGLWRWSSRSHYQMALAHLALRSDEYAAFFREMRERGDYVILDNGAFEGERLSLEELLTAAEKVRANEIVLPDVPGKTVPTMIAILSALRHLPYDLPYRKQAVVQGETQQCWLECHQAICDTPNIDVIGIGATTGSLFADKGGRMALCFALDTLSVNRSETEYHLLGCREDPRELMRYTRLPWVRSIDSQLPVLSGSLGIMFPITGDPPWSRPAGCLDYLRSDTFGSNDFTIDFNVGQFLAWADREGK